jgi:hypothetical protein
MARPRDHHKRVSLAVEDLLGSVGRLIDSVAEAAQEGKKAVAVGKKVVADGRSVISEAKRAKLRKALKAYWSKMKGKARTQRLAKMAAGRRQ